jgi:hypothetical protein
LVEKVKRPPLFFLQSVKYIRRYIHRLGRAIRIEPDMATAHLYLFSDACPSDCLVDGQDEVWHTIVNFVFQSDPKLLPLIEQGMNHEEVLPQDPMYLRFMGDTQSRLPSGQFRKWSTGPGYRDRFCQAFAATQLKFKPIVSACSFQEKTLRNSKTALLTSYNTRIGGIEGRGIGFEEFIDDKGRRHMKHSFLNFHGYHEIQGAEHQMLVLLFMAWFVADQFAFFFRDIITSRRYGFDQLRFTVVSDKLSGDDDFRLRSQRNLRHLIDPENESATLVLARSQESDRFSGDLLADNLAGWMTAAMSDPCSVFGAHARSLISTGIWAGWHQLQPSASKLNETSATERLLNVAVS